MSVKSLRRRWKQEKLEREMYERSFPIIRIIPQADGSYKREEVAWRQIG